MNRISIACSVVCLTVICCLSGVRGDEPGKDEPGKDKPATDASQAETDNQPMSFWMAKKLDHSQGILRALAESDFESIAEHAHQLERLNKVEGFVRRRNPEYTAHLQFFARISKELAQQAERENIDGATLAFNQMTVSCVRCHQTLRQHDQAQELGAPAAKPE